MTDEDPLIDAILGLDDPPSATFDPNAETAKEYNPDGTRRRFATGKPPRIQRQHGKRVYRTVVRQRACADQIERLPDEGEEIVLIMTGDWHGWDLVGAILGLAQPAVCHHLRVATLGFNRTQAHAVGDLIDSGAVGRYTMVVSEIFGEKSLSEYNLLHQIVTDRHQTIAITRNHAKLLLFEMSDGRRITSHGSLNLRRCNAYEQVAINVDPSLHDFFALYIDTIVKTGTL